jgi:dienelactone hydrolase
MVGNIVLIAVLAAGVAGTGKFPEEKKASEGIRDEQYRQMDRYFDSFIDASDTTRGEYWKKLVFSSPAKYDRSVQRYRDDWARFLAMPQPGKTPLNVKREKVAEFPGYIIERVWFDVVPGVQSYGILLTPKVKGPRAGLIALHGHSGFPELLTGVVPEKPDGGYRGFGRTAVERGYVVWCPYIYSVYSDEREPKVGPGAQGRDMLQKKALITGRTLMGLEVAKMRRGVDFLQTLPEVDPKRIGMYGLSKGGHYTLYTAAVEPRLKAAVVSGWFNHRKKKLTAPDDGTPVHFFLTQNHRSEYYLPDLLNRFGDAELAWMVAPRALMIENGDKDPAVLIKDAREEFQRVVPVYERLGLKDHARFAAFDGPHRIDGAESWPFLDKQLGNTPP